MMQRHRPGARLIGSAVIATLVLGSAVGAEAATKKKVVKHTRTVTLNYRGGCTVEANTPVVTGAASPGACTAFGGASYTLAARRGEKYLTVKVKDATGRPVPGQFWVKSSKVANDTEIAFCGALKNFQFPTPNILLDLDAIGGVTSCPGLATSGTITLVFSNLP
jgi:hypothetical protein